MVSTRLVGFSWMCCRTNTRFLSDIANCFLKCSKTYIRHFRTCFIAESFTLDASRASAFRSTGEFLSRRSHNRDIRSQTEGFIPDIEGCIEISLINDPTLLAYPLTDIKREVFL